MSIFNPLVTKLAKKKIPRGVTILVLYFLLLTGASFAIGAVIPPLVDQTTSFVNNFPRFLANLGISNMLSEQFTLQFFTQLGSIPSQLAKTTISIFSNVLALVAVLVFAYYLLSERDKLIDQAGSLLGENKKNDLVRIINNIEIRLGSWARGQATLMLVVGLANFIGLEILGVPFAIALAILAGLLEIVPYIGPIIAAIPAVLIGFSMSPVIGIAVAALTFLIQQLENYVFVPKITQKSTGVNPIITLLALAIGFKLSGIVGLLISVPVFLVLQVITKEYLELRSKISK
jgi:predicted PurR-regulated permease PerM